ncbi:MAG: dihydrolipoyl dehydrogenase [Deinococcales bacterium]
MSHFDLIVIGAGPGGYVAAIRAAQLGLKVACVEKESALGGTCLRVGCIPSKALLESSAKYHEAKEDLAVHGIKATSVKFDLKTMLARKENIVSELTGGIDFLFKRNKVSRYQGLASFVAANEIQVGEETLTAKNILIATGSKSSNLPNVEMDDDIIGDSTTALSYSKVPKHLVVIGAGVIGLELGSVWQRLGAEVTILEYLPRILPGMDEEIAKEAQKLFKKQGLNFELGVKVTGVQKEGKEAIIQLEGKDPVKADRVLMAVGRKPNTEGLNLEMIGLDTDKRGFVPVDEHFQTSVKGVYAIGDVIGGAMLAHKAEEEGIACVEQMVKGYGHVNYRAIPGVVYTEPEIASVGYTEEELNASQRAYRKGLFPYLANGRAKALGHTEGKVKILADAVTDRVLGVHIIGARAGDLIAEAAIAIEFGASAEDLARSSHAHPTLAEIIKEAALAVDKRAIHI